MDSIHTAEISFWNSSGCLLNSLLAIGNESQAVQASRSYSSAYTHISCLVGLEMTLAGVFSDDGSNEPSCRQSHVIIHVNLSQGDYISAEI